MVAYLAPAARLGNFAFPHDYDRTATLLGHPTPAHDSVIDTLVSFGPPRLPATAGGRAGRSNRPLSADTDRYRCGARAPRPGSLGQAHEPRRLTDMVVLPASA